MLPFLIGSGVTAAVLETAVNHSYVMELIYWSNLFI